jgi:hypothetical protein
MKKTDKFFERVIVFQKVKEKLLTIYNHQYPSVNLILTQSFPRLVR